MSDRLAPGEEHWTMRIRATSDLKERLSALATKERRSLAVFIGNALSEYVTSRSTA